ncbi:reverse transcriptase domain-containing protein [Dyadobacter pollutisoli]|uniref:Reverse transcriptase domain-containing protein n=1 Tax=Dyadobacter pollutisoli TaxID=2910158 RepID=A0A9E8ND52_9BACT|nr:reverse transcriptase domain-containing protein [Dyadobacter pollutisoli]WAC13808.1 reverse transcriptase domain-containing protein [Dyadobacter pollutisoli]
MAANQCLFFSGEDTGLLTEVWTECGVMENGVVRSTSEGTPQGGNLSPILSNVMLNELEKRGHKFVRYADDISIFAGSQRASERILSVITDYLESRLKLKSKP